jgi:hypothetical protein
MSTSLDIQQIDTQQIIVLNQPILRSIDQAEYDYVNRYIMLAEDLIQNPGCRHMGVWSPDTDISCQEAENQMKSMTAIIEGKTFQGRPATIEELSAYEVSFADSLGNIILVALDEVIVVGRRHYSAYRNNTASKRELRLGNRADGWPKGFSFLVVFEEVTPDQV